MSSLFISWFGNPTWGSVDRSKIPSQYLPTKTDNHWIQPQLEPITDRDLIKSIEQVVHDARQIFGVWNDDLRQQFKNLNASNFSTEFKNKETKNLIDTTTPLRSHMRGLIDDSRDFAGTQTVDLAMIGINDQLPTQWTQTRPLWDTVLEVKQLLMSHHRDYLWGHSQWAYILLETLQNMSEDELRPLISHDTVISLLAPALSGSVAAHFHTGKEDWYLNGKGVFVTDESISSLSMYRGKVKLLDSVIHRLHQISPLLNMQIIIPTSDNYANIMNYPSAEWLSESLEKIIQFVPGDHYLRA